jgi:threonine dehydratase
MQARYKVSKIVDGSVESEHECYTWNHVEDLKDAIALVKGKAVVENINRD